MNLDMQTFTCSFCEADLPLASKLRRGSKCKACHAKYVREYRAKNIERARELERQRRARRKEQHRAYAAIWYQANKDRIKESSRRRYQRIKSKPSEQRARQEWRLSNAHLTRGYSRSYRQRHRDRVAAYVQAKNAKRRQAQPAWANKFKIRVMYRTASVLTRLTGRKFEVDHIYPLNSPFMCGLHVETNMRVISKAENVRKSNRYWPGQLPCQAGQAFKP